MGYCCMDAHHDLYTSKELKLAFDIENMAFVAV